MNSDYFRLPCSFCGQKGDEKEQGKVTKMQIIVA